MEDKLMKYIPVDEFITENTIDTKTFNLFLEKNKIMLFGAKSNLVREYDIPRILESYQMFEKEYKDELERLAMIEAAKEERIMREIQIEQE